MSDKTYKYLSWEDIEKACLSIYADMRSDGYTPDVILGLLRGGAIPARIFQDLYPSYLEYCSMDVKLYNGIGTREEEPVIKPFSEDLSGKKVLIVDDIWDSGKTMRAVLQRLKRHNVITTTLYWKETAEERPTYYAGRVAESDWLVFPWERHEFLRMINEPEDSPFEEPKYEGPTVQIVTAEKVFKLREITCLGLMDCKQALVRCDGDMKAAAQFLRERGQC